nr:hypothetical protein 6 [Paracoccaceae bacterium]
MTNPRNTPPPHSPSMGVANTNTPSHRERDDNYADKVVQLTQRYRVILCPQHLQLIIQEKEASRSGHWRAKSYHTSRDSLLSACGTRGFLSDPNVEAVLHALPDHVSQLSKK